MPSKFHRRFGKYYRSTTVSRGFRYHFLAIPPAAADRPILVFLHGFPSTSYDWRHQIEYFHEDGYGMIVPDMLGCGETSRPREPEAYTARSVAQDVMDVIDSVDWSRSAPLISISHDWGSAPNSRLMVYHDSRFAAYVVAAYGGLSLVDEPVNFDAMFAHQKQRFGSEVIGYQEFLARDPEAPTLIERNIDSILDIIYPEHPSLWKPTLTTRGLLETWLRSGSRGIRAPWMTSEDFQIAKRELSRNMTARLNWYKQFTDGYNAPDNRELRARGDSIKTSKPVLYLGGSLDAVGLPILQTTTLSMLAHHFETKLFFAGHWLQLEEPAKFNEELDTFIMKVLDGQAASRL